MRIINTLLIITAFLISGSCVNRKSPEIKKIYFGVYEIYDISNIPSHVIDSLNNSGFIKTSNESMAIIGYRSADADVHLYQFNDGDFALFVTKNTINVENNLVAIVALPRDAKIGINDLNEARTIEGNLEFVFNETGKEKWENLTRENTGKRIAFVIGDHIFSLPFINKTNSSGIAFITGIDDEEAANNFAERINFSIPERD